MPLKIQLGILFLVLCYNLHSQFYLQSSVGLENPYNYSYTLNVTPNINTSPLPFENQKFRFFRTKLVSFGAVYNHNPSLWKNRLNFEIGGNVAYMNQFVADTIANPEFTQLLFNAKHINLAFEPEVNVKISVYKRFNITGGIVAFLPIRKWIFSDQGTEIFDDKYSPNFYKSIGLYNLGIEAEFDNFSLEISYLHGDRVTHWKTSILISNSYHGHQVQRWVLTYKYKLNFNKS